MEKIIKSNVELDGCQVSPEMVKVLNQLSDQLKKEGLIKNDVCTSDDYLNVMLGPTWLTVEHYTY